MAKSEHFTFDGGAGTYIGTAIGAFFLTILTAGIGFPWALCMKRRWIAKHTLVDGRRLRFTAHGGGLILLWLKWMFFLLITVGIYGFWLGPNLQRWIVEHTDFQ